MDDIRTPGDLLDFWEQDRGRKQELPFDVLLTTPTDDTPSVFPNWTDRALDQAERVPYFQRAFDLNRGLDAWKVGSEIYETAAERGFLHQALPRNPIQDHKHNMQFINEQDDDFMWMCKGLRCFYTIHVERWKWEQMLRGFW